jgi:hypothetical protein
VHSAIQAPLEEIAQGVVSNQTLSLHEGSPLYSDVQAAVSGFHEVGGSGSYVQAVDSQERSVSSWEDRGYHRDQNHTLTSEDPAEEDAMRYQGPVVDNWYSDAVDSGASESQSSQVRMPSA